jgi:hypothetical protein
MYTRGRAENVRVTFCQRNSIPTALCTAAGNDHATDTSLAGSLDNLVSIGVETIVRKIRAYIDQ